MPVWKCLWLNDFCGCSMTTWTIRGRYLVNIRSRGGRWSRKGKILYEFCYKVRTFWEAHKIWKKSSSCFWRLLSKCTNHEEDFFKLCVLLRKSELKIGSVHLPNLRSTPFKVTILNFLKIETCFAPLKFKFKIDLNIWSKKISSKNSLALLK